MAVMTKRWCLICEQKPAVGVLVRIFVDDYSVATKPNGKPAEVCSDCKEKHQGRLAKPDGKRGTIWAFEPGLTRVEPIEGVAD